MKKLTPVQVVDVFRTLFSHDREEVEGALRESLDLCFCCEGTHTKHEDDCPQQREPTK